MATIPIQPQSGKLNSDTSIHRATAPSDGEHEGQFETHLKRLSSSTPENEDSERTPESRESRDAPEVSEELADDGASGEKDREGPFPICGNDDSKLAANGI